VVEPNSWPGPLRLHNRSRRWSAAQTHKPGFSLRKTRRLRGRVDCIFVTPDFFLKLVTEIGL
jgi:hypothetical protein